MFLPLEISGFADESMTSEEKARAVASHLHYKGGLYLFLGEAQHSETGERMVVYQHLWPHEISLWVRPADLFYGNLENGEPRFKKLN